MADLTFTVIDQNCEAGDQSFFPPRVVMTTKSTTTIATILGYPEYIPSTPPKKYKTLTWSGTSEQIASAINTGQKVADAKYVYSGASQIDSSGHQVSLYSKDYFVPCPASSFLPLLNGFIPNLQGYCWSTDPLSCPVCQDPPIFKSNLAANTLFDEPIGLLGVGPGFHTITPTSLTNIGSQGVVTFIEEPPPTVVPRVINNGLNAAWIIIIANHNYSSLLTDEYTDAEALTNAQVILSNGATAETFARTTGFVSRWTSVIYTLSFTNLIVGQAYVATVDLWDSIGTHTPKQYGFVATAVTYMIVDIIPTPVQGRTITVRAPQVAFA